MRTPSFPPGLVAHCRDAGLVIRCGTGRPTGRLSDLPAKIRARIEIDGEHWRWIGCPAGKGYGQYGGPSGQHWLAHRLVWALLGGELPEDLHHKCDMKACVRPKHLAPLTKSEHTKSHRPPRSACKWGHEFTPANTYWRRGKNGQRSRMCRRCCADRERARVKAMPPEQREALNRANAVRRRERNGWKKQAGSRY